MYLAGRGFRQGSKDHGFRCLEMGNIGAAKSYDIGFGCRSPIAQFDKGAGAFAPFQMRTGDDGSGTDGGMAVQDRLNLDRGYVFAARDDNILQPVADLDIAVGVHNGRIA